jgi:exonuclease III
MRLRIVSWNVRRVVENTAQLALLDQLAPDIVLLQDVARRTAQTMRDSRPPGTVLDTWHGHDGAGRHRGGCLIAASPSWQLQLDASVTEGCMLCGTAVCNSTALFLVSCYAPTNTGPLRAQRPAFFTALARQLDGAPTPLILGMDANGPRVDHPDLARSVWWTPEEEAVLGAGAATCDALRLWYADHPADFQRRTRYYPRGPLADSFHRGRKGKYVRSRYDSIRVSPGIRVLDVRTLYDDAIRAGSDHALLIADIDLS